MRTTRDLAKGIVITAARTARDDVQVIQGQLNTQLGTRFGGAERYPERVTRYAPVAAGFLGLILAALPVRLRRLELASRLHDGSSRADLTAQTLLEAVVWILPAMLIAWAGSEIYPYVVAGLESESFGASNYLTPSVGVIGALLGTVVATLVVRERHLFACFKDR